MLALWTVHSVPPPCRRESLHPQPAQSPFLLLSNGSCSDKNPGWVALEHRNGLRQDLFECHNRPSTCLGPSGLSSGSLSYQKAYGTPRVAEKKGCARIAAQPEAVIRDTPKGFWKLDISRWATRPRSWRRPPRLPLHHATALQHWR